MKFVCHPADRLNIFRALLAPVVVSSPFWYGFPPDQSIVVFLVIFLLAGETNYILHLHVHRPFATTPWLNLLLDLCMGFATGMTASNWRIQHRFGHHRGVDFPYRSHREWEVSRYSALGALSFSTHSIWPTFWQPIAEAFRKGVLANVARPLNYRWAFIEQCLLVALVSALAIWRPALVIFYLVPWYALIFFISRYVDYLNHYGCGDSGNRYECANNCVERLFNRQCHNFGYHTAHHLQPSAHWTELPAIHARIVSRIPPRLLKPFSWSCLLMPYHFMRSWRAKM